METRLPTRKTVIGTAAFMVVVVLLVFGIWRAFNGPTPLAPHSYRVTMVLDDAADLYPRSAVTIAGVDVGFIVKIDPVKRGARVTIELEPKYAPLGSGATAIRRSKSLLGEGYVELAPGPRDAAPIPDGGELASTQVRKAQSLDQALAIFGPKTRRDMNRLFAGLATAFKGRESQLNYAIGRAGPTMDSLSGALAKVDANRAALGQLFDGSADVLGALSEREGELQAAVRAGDQVLSATARQNRALAQTVHDLPAFLAELQRASRRLDEAAPDLDAAVASLTPVTPKVAPALEALNGVAPEFRQLFEELPPVIAAGRRGIPATTRTLRSAEPTLEAIYPELRELIPFVQLTAALEGSLTGFFANVAQLANGTLPGPNGDLATGIGGIPSIWNETIAGWKKRLPTSRPNPYPKPDAQREIEKGTGLQSFDCRHTKNPLYLPAIGLNGVQPCLLQGPWEFQGKSRYYPRLERAAP